MCPSRTAAHEDLALLRRHTPTRTPHARARCVERRLTTSRAAHLVAPTAGGAPESSAPIEIACHVCVCVCVCVCRVYAAPDPQRSPRTRAVRRPRDIPFSRERGWGGARENALPLCVAVVTADGREQQAPEGPRIKPQVEDVLEHPHSGIDRVRIAMAGSRSASSSAPAPRSSSSKSTRRPAQPSSCWAPQSSRGSRSSRGAAGPSRSACGRCRGSSAGSSSCPSCNAGCGQPGSRRQSTPSSGCGRRCGHSDGKPCGSSGSASSGPAWSAASRLCRKGRQEKEVRCGKTCEQFKCMPPRGCGGACSNASHELSHLQHWRSTRKRAAARL